MPMERTITSWAVAALGIMLLCAIQGVHAQDWDGGQVQPAQATSGQNATGTFNLTIERDTSPEHYLMASLVLLMFLGMAALIPILRRG